MYGILTGEF